MSNPATFAATIITGIGVGLILFIFNISKNNDTPLSYEEDKKKKSLNRCFICLKDSSPIIAILCGHAVHDSCLYEKLIRCPVSEIKNYSCLRCYKPIPPSLSTETLCSRCCVCKEKFDKNTTYIYSIHPQIYTLTCGHRLHRRCLAADKLRQETNEKARYKCPYSLLECKTEMPFDSIPDLH